MMDITSEVGSRIRYYRQLRNYSQEELAKFSELHPSYIGQLERGEKTPSIDTLYKVTKGLDITLNSLFNGIEEISEEPEDKAYLCYQLIRNQSPKNQEKIHLFLESFFGKEN